MSIQEHLKHPFSKRKREQARKERQRSRIEDIDLLIRRIDRMSRYLPGEEIPSPMGGSFTTDRNALLRDKQKLLDQV